MADPSGDGEDDELRGTEVLALRVEFDLVPEWSSVVERIARHHGKRVEVGVEGGALVVKVAVPLERKEVLLGEVQRYWQAFVERRKREGRWKS